MMFYIYTYIDSTSNVVKVYRLTLFGKGGVIYAAVEHQMSPEKFHMSFLNI